MINGLRYWLAPFTRLVCFVCHTCQQVKKWSILKTAIVFVLVCCTLNANADTHTPLLTQWFPQSCYHSGSFEQQKHFAGVNKAIVSKGRFAYSCEYGLLWKTEQPILERMVYPLKQPPMKVFDGMVEHRPGRVARSLGRLLNHLVGGNEQAIHR